MRHFYTATCSARQDKIFGKHTNMNILFNGFQSRHTLPVLQSLINILSLKRISTIDEGEPKQLLCKSDHHDFWKILWGEYPIPEGELLPLDDEIIRKMASCEVTTLRMMDRLDPLHPKSYRFRKRLYLLHLQYWNHFLEKKNITHFITINIPHETHDYVIYCLCKIKGIRTIMFWQSPLPDSTFIFEDIEIGPIELQDAFSKLKKKLASHGSIFLPPNFEDYWKIRTNQKELPPSPFYMNDVKKQVKRAHSIFYVLQRTFEFAVFFLKKSQDPLYKSIFHLLKEGGGKYYNRRKLLSRDKRLWKNYRKLSCTPDLTVPYIYVPLHYQPECTTCPMGGIFVDQDLMIKILANIANMHNIALYIKEHPVQRSQGRSSDFYETIRQLTSVTLVDTDFSSAQLIRNSIAVATVTGTAGWEALFETKPVLMFGSFFFQYAPGVFNIRSYAEAKKAIEQIIGGYKGNLELLRVFISSVYQISICGYSDENYKVVSKISAESNSKNIENAILAKIAP